MKWSARPPAVVATRLNRNKYLAPSLERDFRRSFFPCGPLLVRADSRSLDRDPLLLVQRKTLSVISLCFRCFVKGQMSRLKFGGLLKAVVAFAIFSNCLCERCWSAFRIEICEKLFHNIGLLNSLKYFVKLNFDHSVSFTHNTENTLSLFVLEG